MTYYTNLLRQLRKVQSGIQWDAADAIEELEKKRDAERAARLIEDRLKMEALSDLDEARAAWKKSHRDGYSFYELYRDAKARVAELEKERDEARIALGGHATGDFANDDGCGCTMLSLPGLCELHHRWLQNCKARVAELERERDEARRSDAESLELYRRSRERLEARVAELERLIRHRCEIYCAKDYIPRGMHAPDCLVEEAGIK